MASTIAKDRTGGSAGDARWRHIVVNSFDLRLTLESGQFFRYEEASGQGRDACDPASCGLASRRDRVSPSRRASFLLLTQGRALRVEQRGGIRRSTLSYSGADERFVRTLFQLTPAYAKRLAGLRNDPVLRAIIDRYPGLRVMRQDLHEAIIGFICSSQSNIPKIRMNLRLMAESCGERIGGHAYLPAPGKMLDHDVIVAARTGYRAKFLVMTNQKLSKELLDGMSRADYVRSHAMLCELPGVGPKIADCVCLFALGHGEAFPVDVHIARAMKALFPPLRDSDEAAIKRFAQQRWGNDAGIAQQFIYQWARDDLARPAGRHAVRERKDGGKAAVAGRAVATRAVAGRAAVRRQTGHEAAA